jgi:hypothetical protein
VGSIWERFGVVSDKAGDSLPSQKGPKNTGTWHDVASGVRVGLLIALGSDVVLRQLHVHFIFSRLLEAAHCNDTSVVGSAVWKRVDLHASRRVNVCFVLTLGVLADPCVVLFDHTDSLSSSPSHSRRFVDHFSADVLRRETRDEVVSEELDTLGKNEG